MVLYRHVQKSIFPVAFPTSIAYKSICLTIVALAKQLEARTGNGQLNKLENMFLSSILNLQPECVRIYLDAVDDCRHRPNSGGRNILGGGSKCREYYSTRFSLGQTPPPYQHPRNRNCSKGPNNTDIRMEVEAHLPRVQALG